MFTNESKGQPMYCRFSPTVKDLAEELAGQWDCHLHEALNKMAFIGGLCAFFVTNIVNATPDSQPPSGGETEALLNKVFGAVKSLS